MHSWWPGCSSTPAPLPIWGLVWSYWSQLLTSFSPLNTPFSKACLHLSPWASPEQLPQFSGVTARLTPCSVPSSWPRLRLACFMPTHSQASRIPISRFSFPFFLVTKVLSILSSSCLPQSCQLFLSVFSLTSSLLVSTVFGAVFPELPSDPSLSVSHSIWNTVKCDLQSWCPGPSRITATGGQTAFPS